MSEAVGNVQPIPLSEEAQARFFNQVMSTYIVPEIEARQARGEAQKPLQLFLAQVIFEADKPYAVRLNDEVRGKAMMRAADPERSWNPGDDVMFEDIGEITDFALTDVEPNAAHITLIGRSNGWIITFDATYNRQRIAEHLNAAEEFVDAATQALSSEHLRTFVENAFHAAEHLARAELLPLPDERFLKAKTHSTVVGRLHWWAGLGNIDPDAAKLLARLQDLRQGETYVVAERRLQPEEAGVLHERLLAMRAHVVANAPQPGPTPEGRRPVTMIAAKPLEAGQLVQRSDNKMP